MNFKTFLLVKIMKQKEVIVGTLIGLGALFGIGLIYNYYKKKPSGGTENILKTEPDQKNFENNLIFKSTTDYQNHLPVLYERLISGNFSSEPTLENLFLLKSIQWKPKDMKLVESVFFQYFKLCSSLFIEKFQTNDLVGNVSKALIFAINVENLEDSRFVVSFVYEHAMKYFSCVSLEDEVWRLWAILIIKCEDQKKFDNFLSELFKKGIPFGDGFLGFFYHVVVHMDDQQKRQLIKLFVNNKEKFIEFQKSNLIFQPISVISNSFDSSYYLKEMYPYFIKMDGIFDTQFYELLTPKDYQDSLLMLPILMEYFQSEDSMKVVCGSLLLKRIGPTFIYDTNIEEYYNCDGTSELSRLLFRKLANDEFGDGEVKDTIMNFNALHIYYFSKKDDEEILKISFQISLDELLKCDFNSLTVNHMNSLMCSCKENILKDLNEKDFKKFVSMMKKLMGIVPQQLKSQVCSLVNLFEFMDCKNFVKNNLDSVGELIVLFIRELGKSNVDTEYASSMSLYMLINIFKKEFLPWKESLFHCCFRILKKKKNKVNPMVTSCFMIIFSLMEYFEEEMESLVSTPGFLDFMVDYSLKPKKDHNECFATIILYCIYEWRSPSLGFMIPKIKLHHAFQEDSPNLNNLFVFFLVNSQI
jgi:hypothetical protein